MEGSKTAIHGCQCSCYRRGNSCIPCANREFTTPLAVSEEHKQKKIKLYFTLFQSVICACANQIMAKNRLKREEKGLKDE